MVTVNTMDGKTINFHAQNDNDMKVKIFDLLGIPICQQVLTETQKNIFNLHCPNYPWKHTVCTCKNCGPR